MTCEIFGQLDQEIINLLRLSTHRAAAADRKGRQANQRTAVLGAAWQFLRSYVLNFGALDGWAGLKASWLSAAAIFLREIKLWELQNSNASASEAANTASLKVFAPEQHQLETLPAPSKLGRTSRGSHPQRCCENATISIGRLIAAMLLALRAPFHHSEDSD